ncbi:hypothetical protein NPIL_167591 [Nephila pilipes]|uniref:Uncharacterized protein n=1 Tax=Nephila pilipes TaxID=299642 RepID=A0A8X6Q1P7_NEPPI|nr:hypothetical protein NPIL_167591 [Nephila pilipes]
MNLNLDSLRRCPVKNQGLVWGGHEIFYSGTDVNENPTDTHKAFFFIQSKNRRRIPARNRRCSRRDANDYHSRYEAVILLVKSHGRFSQWYNSGNEYMVHTVIVKRAIHFLLVVDLNGNPTQCLPLRNMQALFLMR